MATNPRSGSGDSSWSQDRSVPTLPSKDNKDYTSLRTTSASSPETPTDKVAYATFTDDAGILEKKTLNRKNFKHLSLSSPVPQNEIKHDESHLIREPTSMKRRQRPAPILNLPNGTASSQPELSQMRPVMAQQATASAIFADSRQTTSNVITSQTLSRPNSAGNIHLDINASNRNIDPENHASTEMLINSMSQLELDTRPDSQRSKSTPNDVAGRKRQTVISSISPTKMSGQQVESKVQLVDTFHETRSPIATTSKFKLRNKDLLTLKQLGSGNSGSVSKVLHLPSQKTMAKKIIHVDSKSIIQTQIIRELRILHECQSPYIIEFYGAFLNNNNTIVICMEYCNCGSLDKILPLCENRQFPLYVLKKLSFAILSGLSYLYSKHRIIHRDIKPNNVLMTHRGEFKLCDFGVSRELTNSLAMADTFVGTSMYMSPERIQGLNYGVKSDVWSMGLMMIELASGLPVWTDDYEDENGNSAYNSLKSDVSNNSSFRGPEGILDLLQRIVNEKPPSLKHKTNPVTKSRYDTELCDFIDSCLIKNESERKTPWQLLEDKQGFLRGVEEGIYDQDHKAWAKRIRKINKEVHEADK
ncbi:STE7 [Candida margitis]|uniref:STE7 n=1 Tax=Candida margitis TaxID=1775924 RepID=UPI002226467B|nr:STE7 [Candida margitis]KAI5969661.1 STE7 [Candida margitis]